VRGLIRFAYDLKEPQVVGGPKWIDDVQYDIVAKVDDSEAGREQDLSQQQRLAAMKLRVQDLLARRFALTLRRSVRPLGVLALVVAKSGPKFSQAKSQPNVGGQVRDRQIGMKLEGKQWVLTLEDAPLRYLILMLGDQPEMSGRILLDRTGLKGNYGLKLRWESQRLTSAVSPESDVSGPTLFTALTEQLGLRLESRKEPMDVVEIDHVERPSEN